MVENECIYDKTIVIPYKESFFEQAVYLLMQHMKNTNEKNKKNTIYFNIAMDEQSTDGNICIWIKWHAEEND